MMEQILLRSGPFDGLREIGGFGQPLHALYPQIRAVLAGVLTPAGDLLAEPVVDRVNNRIDWYTEGDPEEPPIVLSDLPEEQRQAIRAQLNAGLERGRELAEQYATVTDARQNQLGAILRAVLATPAETEVFVVNGRPVVVGWGFTPDRPWAEPVSAVESTLVSPGSLKPHRDVVIPEVPMPEQRNPTSLDATPVESEVRTEALPDSVPSPTEPLDAPSVTLQPESPTESLDAPSVTLQPESESEPKSPEPLPVASSPEPKPPELPPELPVLSQTESTVSTSSPSLAQASPESESAPPVWMANPSLTDAPETVGPLRYVVVGSWGFWSVFALAVLLVLGALGLRYWQASTIGQVAIVPGLSGTPDSDALAEAQRIETELRDRLEQGLARLTEQRKQCRLSTGAESSTLTVGSGEPGNTESTLPVEPSAVEGSRHTVKIPPVADADPHLSSPVSTSAPNVPNIPNVPNVPSGDRGSEKPVVAAPPATPAEAATAPKNPLTETPSDTLESAITAPSVASDDAQSRRSSPTGRQTPDKTGVAPVATATNPSSGKAAQSRSLEEELSRESSQPLPSSSHSAPPLEPPPVKSEPTPEERREFAQRMSAAGAVTGEITVTLLWNSHSDLDLVVTCPAGQSLDYQNPAECGGTLDVDANTARDKLQDRPMENVFWPSGQAVPGTYRIAVRYLPRKDEQSPQETSFQVRLGRDGRESVFKGKIRPNTVVPVTDFRVEH
ncbi:MAG: hypothetical protein IAF00_04015 [Phycisphaerales bacterium]|nr:hypothetical protein [Phycisphaerales bacterium]